jgi:DNA-binding XRE family transcriptional regulator
MSSFNSQLCCTSFRSASEKARRAARGLLGLGQSQLADIVGLARRTIIRIEADDAEPTNPRRREIYEAIRDRLEEKFGIRFVYPCVGTGDTLIGIGRR